MGILRIIGLGLLGVVFVVGLTTANLAVAADRTVLNDDFVTDTADDAGLYALIAEELREEAAADAPDDGLPDELPIEGVDFETLLEETITEDWVREQFEPAIENVFAFLQGDSDSLEITIDTDELQNNAATTLTEESELDLGALPDERAAQLDRMTESPDQFAAERDQFRTEQKTQIQDATDEELSESELEAALDDQLTDNRETIQSQFTAAIPPAVSGVDEPVETLADAWVDAMLGEVDYEAFTTTVEGASDTLTERAVKSFFEEAAPFPDSIEFTDDDIPAEEREDLDTARDAISAFSLVPFALGALVLVLAGGVFVLASPGGAAIGLGTATALVGGGTAGVTLVLQEELPALLTAIPDAVRGSIVTVLRAILDVVFIQSALLAAVGMAAIAVGVAVRRDLLLAGGVDEAPEDPETATESTTSDPVEDASTPPEEESTPNPTTETDTAEPDSTDDTSDERD